MRQYDGMQNASHPAPSLAALVHADGEWIRCNACDQAFWGRANVTAVIRAKAQRHAHKAHNAAGGRPQRRAAAAVALDSVDLVAIGHTLAAAARKGALRSLGAGVFRQGYAVETAYVIKLAKRSDGNDCNLAEAQTFATAPAHLRQWLCPVLAVDPQGEWVLMQYAERVGQLGWSAEDRAESVLGKFIGDLHGGNIGMIDGHMVVTDYAAGMGQGKPADWQRGRRGW